MTRLAGAIAALPAIGSAGRLTTQNYTINAPVGDTLTETGVIWAILGMCDDCPRGRLVALTAMFIGLFLVQPSGTPRAGGANVRA